MALVKCKECGEMVSTKAKACQKCGAVPPKQTSLVTWFVLLAVIYGVYAASKDTPQRVSSPAASSASSSVAAAGVAVPAPVIPIPAWKNTTSADQLTGKKSSYATSPSVEPSKRMPFPYSDVKSWMAVGCDADSEWAYVGFNEAPNLLNTETRDGYSDIRTRIRWNEAVETIGLSQEWGASFLHFDDVQQISKMITSSSVLLELQWYGTQESYFEYSLNGSSEAIAEMRRQCSEY